jgi:DNA-directed RNA polymerase subunit RPC12/RpoP
MSDLLFVIDNNCINMQPQDCIHKKKFFALTKETKDGYKIYECSNCNKSLIELPRNSTAHRFSWWFVTGGLFSPLLFPFSVITIISWIIDGIKECQMEDKMKETSNKKHYSHSKTNVVCKQCGSKTEKENGDTT